MPFEKARNYTHSLKLKTLREWKKWAQSKFRPTDIPSKPEDVYKNQGWKGYGDWLGTNRVANKDRTFLSFLEAKELVKKLRFVTFQEWTEWASSSQRPSNIPASPNHYYKNNGWISWGDWFGDYNFNTRIQQLKKKPNGWWSKIACAAEAGKYSTRSSFEKGNAAAYVIARRNGWLDEICSHMLHVGNRYKRAIYSFKFSDKSVYIGLSKNPEFRKKEHLDHHELIRKKIQDGVSYTFEILTDYVDNEEAIKLEHKYLEYFKEKHWSILNRAKTGTLGGAHLLWTKENCKKEAQKYKTRSEFSKKSKGAYLSARMNRWLNEVCNHMNQLIKPRYYWTKVRCHEEALKFTNRSEFSKKSSSAYTIAKRKKWLNEICSHIKDKKKQNAFWSKEQCKKEALNYKTKKEFREKSKSAYSIASKKGWLNEICKHMMSRDLTG